VQTFVKLLQIRLGEKVDFWIFTTVPPQRRSLKWTW